MLVCMFGYYWKYTNVLCSSTELKRMQLISATDSLGVRIMSLRKPSLCKVATFLVVAGRAQGVQYQHTLPVHDACAWSKSQLRTNRHKQFFFELATADTKTRDQPTRFQDKSKQKSLDTQLRRRTKSGWLGFSEPVVRCPNGCVFK